MPLFDAASSRLRQEAAIEPDAPAGGPLKKDTQIIAIYGKGGIGKSFTFANLSYMMAQQGKRVLLMGADPEKRHDVIVVWWAKLPDHHRNLVEEEARGRGGQNRRCVLQARRRVRMELGGPEVGRGCGGRGIIHGFELLEKLGFHNGASTPYSSIFSASGVRRVRSADRTRHVPEGDRCCIE